MQPDSDRPLDGVLNPEPTSSYSSGFVVKQPVESSTTYPVSSQTDNMERDSRWDLNQDPASVEPCDTVVKEEVTSSATYSEASVRSDVDSRQDLNHEPACVEPCDTVVKEEVTSSATYSESSLRSDVDSRQDLNHEPASAEPSGPVVREPGHFAHANPDLAEFVDVEEDLMEGARGDYGGFAIAEEDVDDYLDADDPAYMDDILYRS